jgi:hypothetical protein
MCASAAGRRGVPAVWLRRKPRDSVECRIAGGVMSRVGLRNSLPASLRGATLRSSRLVDAGFMSTLLQRQSQPVNPIGAVALNQRMALCQASRGACGAGGG